MTLNNCAFSRLHSVSLFYDFFTDLQGIGSNQAHILSWEETTSGPSHALTWFVVCKSRWKESRYLKYDSWPSYTCM